MYAKASLWSVTGAACFLVGLLLTNPAFAKWPSDKQRDAEQAAWFAAQHNKHNDWCCDKTDGHWYEGNYTFDQDGGVTLDGGVKIEPYKVLDNPNPTGKAVWWHNDAGTTYCFSPGVLG